MASKRTLAPADQLSLLLLEQNYRRRPHDYFGWMLDAILSGMPLSESDVPKEEQARMTDILAAYEQAVKTELPFTDILGPVYMNLASHGSRDMLGQYFTPFHIATMMAKMSLMDIRPGSNDGKLWRALDPTCGSGVMMLCAAQHVLTTLGASELRHWSFTGVDLDSVCARMFAVQFFANVAIHGIEIGEVLCLQGNALATPDEWRTVLHMTHAEQEPTPVAAIAGQINRAGAASLEQLELFKEAA